MVWYKLEVILPICGLLVFCRGLYAKNDTCLNPPLPHTYTMNSKHPFLIIYEWPQIDFNWKNLKVREEAVMKETFIQKNVIISKVKVWKDRVYMTTPRFKEGVPVTLATVFKQRVLPHQPILRAFPDWYMQEIGHCNALQSATGIEIDREGRLWIVDSGIINSYSKNRKPTCLPKIVIIDLNSVKTIGCNLPSNSNEKEKQSLFGFYSRKCPENNYKLVHLYEFPRDVVSPSKNFLGEIVLDSVGGYHAYIVDSGEEPGIVVYNFVESKSWKISDDMTMRPKPNAGVIEVDGTKVPLKGLNIHGIALSPITDRRRIVYYSVLGGYHVYSIPTSVLRTKKTDVSPYITDLGMKQSVSDGMYCDARGNIYYGLLGCNIVATWNPAWGPLKGYQKKLEQNDGKLVWPDGFAIDDDLGELYVVTNRKQNLLFGEVNIKKEDNYRLIRAALGSQSYKVPYNSAVKGAIDMDPQVNIL